jgi:LAO/AO transport system kinase
MVSDLVSRFGTGDVRALAQAISLVERDDPRARALLEALSATERPHALSVGLTGAPGAGKSTLADALLRLARRDGRTVGVLAVDPSSPFSGGALLGDRLRMDAHLLDPGVFVRSMATRGQLGGLSPAAGEVAWLLGAFGFDEIVVETVGTGQSELEVPALVDTTIVVLTPGMGDDVQLEKAGIMEIADVFVVNKADRPGADRLVRELRTALNLGARTAWRPPILATVASEPDAAIDAVWQAVADHRAHLAADPDAQAASARRLRRATAAFVAERARAWALRQLDVDGGLAAALERHRLPAAVGDDLCERAGLDAQNGISVVRCGTPTPVTFQSNDS